MFSRWCPTTLQTPLREPSKMLLFLMLSKSIWVLLTVVIIRIPILCRIQHHLQSFISTSLLVVDCWHSQELISHPWNLNIISTMLRQWVQESDLISTKSKVDLNSTLSLKITSMKTLMMESPLSIALCIDQLWRRKVNSRQLNHLTKWDIATLTITTQSNAIKR